MPALHSVSVDPCACPVCGQPNRCAMEAAKTSGQAEQPCWCVKVHFSPDLLARVPAPAQGKACICEQCAQSAAATQGSGHV